MNGHCLSCGVWDSLNDDGFCQGCDLDVDTVFDEYGKYGRPQTLAEIELEESFDDFERNPENWE